MDKTLPQLDRTRLHIYSDFDGTITEKDTLSFLAENLGGGRAMVEAMGKLMRNDELSLRDGIAGLMRSIRAPFAEAVKLLHERIVLDPGFVPFARWCAEERIPLTILSAGFREIIDLFLRTEDFPGVEIYANQLQPYEERGWQCVFRDATPFGHDKSKALRTARSRDEYVIFIGDGLSDRAPAEVADEVFAKHSLAKYCRAQNIFCHEYENFTQIQALIEPRIKQ